MVILQKNVQWLFILTTTYNANFIERGAYIQICSFVCRYVYWLNWVFHYLPWT